VASSLGPARSWGLASTLPGSALRRAAALVTSRQVVEMSGLGGGCLLLLGEPMVVIVLAVLVAVTASFQVVLANCGVPSSQACHARSRATLGGSTMLITTSSGTSSMVLSRLSDPNWANRW
jgi:hypothetical protein